MEDENPLENKRSTTLGLIDAWYRHRVMNQAGKALPNIVSDDAETRKAVHEALHSLKITLMEECKSPSLKPALIILSLAGTIYL